MKISFITTVFNEKKTIEKFLDSLFSQTKLPDEIIIVDGGSRDRTVSGIKYKVSSIKKKNKLNRIKFIILIKPGNRSVGRNEAIKKAKGDIIVCSDSGNILDKKWLENITRPFKDKSIDVVAGYYKGLAKNVFQKCLVPYVLVMPDKVSSDNFLPATRSMAFTKAIWKKAGGFDERFSHNEDYVFSNKLKEVGAKIVFAGNAIVNWIPRNSFKEAFVMFFRFAFGDAESGILRTSVLLLFARYFIGLYLIFLSILYKSPFPIVLLLISLVIYIIWSVKKNYKYVGSKEAIKILPLLQLTADVSVLSGTIIGVLKKIKEFNYRSYVKENKYLFFIITVYAVILFLTIKWGIPNKYHPFPYHMDEWHQLNAIRAILKHGTTTIPGAAQIPFLYPVLSGIYLLPFIFAHIINPFSLKSPLDDLLMQEKLFIILRSINLLYGVGSILLIYRISKKYLKINAIIPVFFFTISPIMLLLSAYFKYDIGLLFFIILSLELLFRFGQEPSLRKYIFASIACGLALSVKFSAIPLIFLLILAFYLFIPAKKRNYKYIFIGIFFYSATFILIGSPNILFGRADYRELLYSNLITGPQQTTNIIFSNPWWVYLTLTNYPILFGHLFYYLGLLSTICIYYFLLVKSRWKIKSSKNILFLMISFTLFIASIAPLKIGAIGNRVIVLLPFLSLTTGIFLSRLHNVSRGVYRYALIILLVALISTQFFESAIWIYTKLSRDPQKESSEWIQKKVKADTVIGIENIPIYQYLPNIIVKEFYQKLYQVNKETKYNYEIIDYKSKRLPAFIVITNDELSTKHFKQSPKNILIKRLLQDGYKKMAVFTPDLILYKLIGSDVDYYFSGIIPSPSTISFYYK